jgi:glutamate dehydrogenase/leucine dehydrogenase
LYIKVKEVIKLNKYIDSVYDCVVERNSGFPEFQQVVKRVLTSLEPVLEKHPEFQQYKILERIVEPEHQLIFSVLWVDDQNEIHMNRGFCIGFNSTIGPCKGGLHFCPDVNLGIIKSLGFEQVFKNSLTGLRMGGGMGGSDFDPKGKSDNEVLNFCQRFLSELYRCTGPHGDISACGTGVGNREIGYLLGAHEKLVNRFNNVLNGMNSEFSGSFIHPEATGYGITYFLVEMLKSLKKDLKGKIVTVSGSGNVAQHVTEKINILGGKVVTLSDSDGYVYDPNGITLGEKLDFVFKLKNTNYGRVKEYAEEFNAEYIPNKRPWDIKCDIAIPCATQNEIEIGDSQILVDNGCFAVPEGANMPTTIEATDYFLENKVVLGPAKAANAGGVAISGLRICQDGRMASWTREEVGKQLRDIMVNIYKNVNDSAKKYGNPGNLVMGANIAGFMNVAKAMIAFGAV